METTIVEALRLGRENSRGCAEHLANMERAGRLVEEFIGGRLNLVSYSELKTHHVLALIRDMESRGRSPNYIRHVVNTIRLAGNYMQDYYGMEGIKIEQRHLPARQELVKNWLTFEQLSKACQLAMEVEYREDITSARSHPQPMKLGRLIILVCGLCGLRLTEFCRLDRTGLVGAPGDWRLVIGGDTEDGVRGAAKNDASRRVIPIMDMVADALLEYWGNHRQWSADRTCNAKRVRAVLRMAYVVTGEDMFKAVAPKDLRKTFVNELDEDVADKWITAYGGWAFKGEMLRSYAAIKPRVDGTDQARDMAVEKLRGKVVSVVESRIDGMQWG